MYTCAHCTVLACRQENPEQLPKNCPMHQKELMQRAYANYHLPENNEFYITSSKLEARYPGMRFLKNDFDTYEDWAVCGTRGWLCPNDIRFTEQDKKIYEREQVRLRLSLDAAMRKGAEKIILMMHYPPMNDKKEDSAFTELFKEYPIRKVVYGHLHGEMSHATGFEGERYGITYELVAADYLEFCPKRIL